MAKDNGGNGRKVNYFGKRSKSESPDFDEGDGEESEEPALGLDIGLGNCDQTSNRNFGLEGTGSAACGGGPSSGSNETIRREDNPPFSFKHFLSRTSGQPGLVLHGGARPKVYPASTGPPPPSPRLGPAPGGGGPADVSSAASAGLPDFVQDHLLVEQAYLSGGSSSGSSQQGNLSLHLDGIPDFSQYSPSCDLPFDLTTAALAAGGGGGGSGGRAPPPDLGQQQSQEVGTSKSLPDFLSDGPIRNDRAAGPTPSPAISPERRPNNLHSRENERLRRECDSLRRQLSDQIARSETLESELTLLRERDRSGLENLIQDLEESVRRYRKRLDEAELRANKLKSENNSLRAELDRVRNTRGGGVRSSDLGGAASSSAQQTDSERLASQLRNAANTAELSLRHLLIGVDNLRLLAASLETSGPPEQPVSGGIQRGRRRHSSSDGSTAEDDSGPAL